MVKHVFRQTPHERRRPWLLPEEQVESIQAQGGQVYYCQQCDRVIGYMIQRGPGPHWKWRRRYCSRRCKQKAYLLRHGQRRDRPGRPRKLTKVEAETSKRNEFNNA